MRHGNRSPSNGCPGANSIVFAAALMAFTHPPIPGAGSFARIRVRPAVSNNRYRSPGKVGICRRPGSLSPPSSGAWRGLRDGNAADAIQA